MRISDWSSDVCSSDLVPAHFQQIDDLLIALVRSNFTAIACIAHLGLPLLCLEGDEPGIEPDAVEESVRINPDVANLRHRLILRPGKIGRASCRERVCQYV